MVLTEDSNSHCHSNSSINSRFNYNHASPPCYYCTPPPSSAEASRSMRTIRSAVFNADQSPKVSDNHSDPVIDLRVGDLANKSSNNSKSHPSEEIDYVLDISRAFSDFSACSSYISGELQRLCDPGRNKGAISELEPDSDFIQREAFSTEIIEIISPEDLQPTVKLCVEELRSSSIAVKRSAAAKLRLLANNRADNRALIGPGGRPRIARNGRLLM